MAVLDPRELRVSPADMMDPAIAAAAMPGGPGAADLNRVLGIEQAGDLHRLPAAASARLGLASANGNLGRVGWATIPVRRGSVEMDPLLELCRMHGARVMGGFARFMCSPNETPARPSDVDVFPIGTMAECNAAFGRLCDSFRSAGLVIRHESAVALTFAPGDRTSSARIQLIRPVKRSNPLMPMSVLDVLDAFDFSVVRVAINADGRTATASPYFCADERTRTLRIEAISAPVGSLMRAIKFARKGYRLPADEAMKLLGCWGSEAHPTPRAGRDAEVSTSHCVWMSNSGGVHSKCSHVDVRSLRHWHGSREGVG